MRKMQGVISTDAETEKCLSGLLEKMHMRLMGLVNAAYVAGDNTANELHVAPRVNGMFLKYTDEVLCHMSVVTAWLDEGSCTLRVALAWQYLSLFEKSNTASHESCSKLLWPCRLLANLAKATGNTCVQKALECCMVKPAGQSAVLHFLVASAHVICS